MSFDSMEAGLIQSTCMYICVPSHMPKIPLLWPSVTNKPKHKICTSQAHLVTNVYLVCFIVCPIVITVCLALCIKTKYSNTFIMLQVFKVSDLFTEYSDSRSNDTAMEVTSHSTETKSTYATSSSSSGSHPNTCTKNNLEKERKVFHTNSIGNDPRHSQGPYQTNGPLDQFYPESHIPSGQYQNQTRHRMPVEYTHSDPQVRATDTGYHGNMGYDNTGYQDMSVYSPSTNSTML